jgi:peptide/nickel transport system substrate-binding protein
MRTRRVKWLASGISGVAAIAAAALAATALGAGQAGGIIVDGTTDSVTNIDPAGNYDFGSGTVDYQIFQHLLEYQPGKSGPQPVLATRCGFVGKTLKTYSCTLRRGVQFSNGEEMTSADVKWSFDRVVKIKDSSGIYSLLSNMRSITTNGRYGVTFHLKQPQSTWGLILTTGAAQIVPKSVYPANKILPNSAKQVGTGPYLLDSYTPGQQAVFKVNPNYWGPKPKNDGVIIRYYSKSSTMKLALQKGDLDMAFRDFTPTEYKSLAQKGLVVHKGAGSSIRYLVFNVNRAPTDDVNVRRAVAYLFPRTTIASRVYNGTVQPLYSMVPKGLPGHIDAFKTYFGAKPNVAKARAALAKSGANLPVSLDLWYTPSHYGDASADEFAEIKRALERGGLFKVNLKSAEWAQYSDALGDQYGSFQLGWFPDYVDAENYLLPFYQSSSNFTKNTYKSTRMDAVLKKEQAAKTGTERLLQIRQAQVIAATDVPIIPYWQGSMIAVAKKGVKGVDRTLDPSFVMRFWLISK